MHEFFYDSIGLVLPHRFNVDGAFACGTSNRIGRAYVSAVSA